MDKENMNDMTDVPDCICYDSNLPAHKECPYCYPQRGRS
jgi:hypothetical protein